MKRLDYSLIPEKYRVDAAKTESLLRSFGFDVKFTKDYVGALRVAKGCKVYFSFSGKPKVDHFIYETLLFESDAKIIDDFLRSGKVSPEVIDGALLAKAQKSILEKELNLPVSDDSIDAVEYLFNPAKRN